MCFVISIWQDSTHVSFKWHHTKWYKKIKNKFFLEIFETNLLKMVFFLLFFQFILTILFFGLAWPFWTILALNIYFFSLFRSLSRKKCQVSTYRQCQDFRQRPNFGRKGRPTLVNTIRPSESFTSEMYSQDGPKVIFKIFIGLELIALGWSL